MNVAEMLRTGAEYIAENGLAQHGGYFRQEKNARPACAVGACAAGANIGIEQAESLLERKGIDTRALEDFNDSAANADEVIARMHELADRCAAATGDGRG